MSGLDGRILDKQNYSTETLNVFGYISAYFIDLFYNHLYDQAIRYHRQRQVNTITDGYKCSLDAFLQSINKHDPILYKELVHGIHQTFLDYGFTGLSYQNCIDKIVKSFVPQDYWEVISFDDKSKILGTIITNSTKQMIHKIASSHLLDVIDNHSDTENATLWQDEFIDILIIEREKLYQEFINVKTNTPSNNALIDTLKKEIKLLYDEKKSLQIEVLELKKKLLNCKKVIIGKHKQIEEYKEKYEEYKEKYENVAHNHKQETPDLSDDNYIETSPDPVHSSPHHESSKTLQDEYVNNKIKQLTLEDDDLYVLEK